MCQNEKKRYPLWDSNYVLRYPGMYRVLVRLKPTTNIHLTFDYIITNANNIKEVNNYLNYKRTTLNKRIAQHKTFKKFLKVQCIICSSDRFWTESLFLNSSENITKAFYNSSQSPKPVKFERIECFPSSVLFTSLLIMIHGNV